LQIENLRKSLLVFTIPDKKSCQVSFECPMGAFIAFAVKTATYTDSNQIGFGGFWG
jgi:hypothetical protein